MRFIVDESVLRLFPDLAIGVLHGQVQSVRSDFAATLQRMRNDAAHAATAALGQVEDIGDHPNIAAWRDAYRAFGTKPNKYRPTHEAMARRLLKDPVWPSINSLVDVYLTNQVEHLLPHGGYDADHIEGDLLLTRSVGSERFLPLGGGEEATEEGEVIYRDSVHILTRRWNFRDCDVTKITSETTNFILMIESPTAQLHEPLNKALADLERRYAASCHGVFHTQVFIPTPSLNNAEV